MFFLSLFKSPTFLKWFAIAGFLVMLVGGATTLTFSKTKAYYVAQGDSRVLKITEEKDKAERDFAEYREAQAARVRAIEVSSSAEAASAAGTILLFQQKDQKAAAAYALLLSQRKEVAGNLSSAAVDTINSGVTP